MGILARLEGRGRGVRADPGFAAAEVSRLTASLVSETQFINTTLRWQLRALRARSRQVAQNNPFGRKFAQMVVDNVCGAAPFGLEGKITFNSGKLDEASNEKLEQAWLAWGRKGNCEITARWSWNTVQRLLVRILAVDGELLARKLRGPEYGRHGIKLQMIDVDRLPEWKNAVLDGGGAIHAGVEVDAYGTAVAYHLLKRKPSQWQTGGLSMETERYSAEDIIHVFVPEHAEQIRGVPWMYAALVQLVHLGMFEEAAVVAAYVGAAQMGFIQSADGGAALANSAGRDPAGNPQIDAEPGSFPMLPPGYTMQPWNPKYPDAAVGPFVKSALRAIASGFNVAYHNLASDLEGVNYSSARIGELDERDGWTSIQRFVFEHLHDPFVCDEWLPMQVLRGVLPFDIERLDRYRKFRWQPRVWGAIDPLKEIGASIEAVQAKLKSRTRVIAEMGDDVADVFEEFAQEEALAEELGLSLDPVTPKAAGIVDTDAADAGDTDVDAGDGAKKGRANVPRWRDPARGGEA